MLAPTDREYTPERATQIGRQRSLFQDEGRGDSQRSPYRFSGTISLADTHGLSIPTSEAPIEAETDAPVERYVWTRHVFLAKPRGLSSFIPAVALSVFVKMVVVLCPVMGAQFLFTWGSHDKKSGTIMFAAGANLAVLGLLLTCRTTVENIRKYKVSAAMIAEDPRHRSRSRARKYLGTAGLEYTPSSGWERVLPCIDWSLLRPGSFGLAFSQIVLVWTASIFFKFILVASALSAFVGVADILEGTLQLVFLSVSLFLFVEKSPIKPHRESMKSAILISLMLCVFYQAARYLFSGLLYLSLARLTYLERTIPIIIVCDTFSLCFCFFLPDIPRLRLVLLRSLAPSIIKPAALFKPQLLYGYKTTVHPSKPPNVEQTSCETIEELDYAGPALVNYGLCLRIICCAVSRTGVFMPFNPERMFKVALTTLIVSWTLTVAIMAWIRSRIGIQIANARSGEKKTWPRSGPSDFDLALPLAPFDSLLALKTSNRTAQLRSSDGLHHRLCIPIKLRRPENTHTNSGAENMPFSPCARLQFLALSHYVVAIGYSPGAFVSVAFVSVYVFFTSGSTVNFRSTIDEDLPIPVGNGIAAGIVPPATYTAVSFSCFIALADITVQCAIAWWMSRWGGLCYGGDASLYHVFGGRQASGGENWDCRKYLCGAATLVFVTAAVFFAVGCILRGIAGPL